MSLLSDRPFRWTAAAVGLCLAACGQETSTPPSPPPVPAVPVTAAAPAAAPTPAIDAQAEADRALNEKLGNYISDCLNAFNDSMGQSDERYFLWVGSEETGPTGRERHVYGTYTVNEPTQCRAAVTKAAAMLPADQALHAAAEAYISALETAVPLINDAYRYYEQEDYRDDGFAKGRQMHAPLVAAFKAFRDARAQLSTLVDAQSRALTERRISRLAGDPAQATHVAVERAILLAQDLVNATKGWKVESRKLVGIELEPFQALVTSFEARINELRATPDAGRAGSFASDADGLLQHAKGTMRRIRDGQAFSRGELMNLSGSGAWMCDGAPPRMLKEYNDLVDTYNGIQW